MTTKLALITGASRGLGYAMAEALSADYHILAVGRTTGALEELDDRIKANGGAATLAPMDITVEAAMATLCRGIFDRWGKLDLWVHTAAHAAPLTPVSSIDSKDMEKSVDVNVTAVSRLIAFVAPLLGDTGQALFFEDPQAGKPFFGSYGATKAAQTGLVKSWMAETQKTGPKIHLLQPEAMPTATRARFFPGEDTSALTRPEAEARRLLTSVGLL